VKFSDWIGYVLVLSGKNAEWRQESATIIHAYNTAASPLDILARLAQTPRNGWEAGSRGLREPGKFADLVAVSGGSDRDSANSSGSLSEGGQVSGN